MISDMNYGIFGYSNQYPGIEGRIKTNLDDFIVQEISENGKVVPIPPDKMFMHGDKGGLFVGGRVWKKGIDNYRMLRIIAKAFGVQIADVSVAGIKDTRAVTTQLFSVYQPKKMPNDPYLHENIELDSYQYYREKMYPGRLYGNRFTITIREYKKDNINIEEINKLFNLGIINHYGYQRFGGLRPITAEFGRLLINRKYKEAIDVFIGGEDNFRKIWLETHDPDVTLLEENIPIIERDILKQLSKRPSDPRAAISKIPQFLFNISQSAFISLLTNHYLSIRRDVDTIQPGERNVNINKHRNIEIALPSNRWKQPLNKIWKEVFDYLDVKMKEFKQIRHTTRLLWVYPENFKILESDDEKLKITFDLQKGSYATVVLREIMKSPPSHYI